MRRTHLRKRNNILKRLLFHTVGFNLALLVREKFGIGKPRTLQGTLNLLGMLQLLLGTLCALSEDRGLNGVTHIDHFSVETPHDVFATSATGC